MFAGIAENRHEEIGGAIGDEMLFDEIRRGGYKDGDLHNALDAVEAAESGLCLSKDVDGAGARRSLSMRNRQLIADPARMHKLAAVQRKLAGCEKQGTALGKRNVVGSRCRSFWNGYAQILRRLSIVSVIALILACKGAS